MSVTDKDIDDLRREIQTVNKVLNEELISLKNENDSNSQVLSNLYIMLAQMTALLDSVCVALDDKMPGFTEAFNKSMKENQKHILEILKEETSGFTAEKSNDNEDSNT